ncbi:hypothetical protein HY439_03090 [Candidatus Microgenomates bacterium]|nr:hypothetical protein [Candidatus Microgenomates bacterium]
MKKIISLSFVILVLLIIVASPIYAKENSLLPPWFTNAIKPIQDSINSLIQKIDNHEIRIAELEKKVEFDLPNQWGTEFYEDRFILRTTGDSPLTIPTTPPNNCSWNNAVIDSDATARATAHLSTGDIYGAGNCHGITFRTSNIPPSGTTFETDVYVFWQGTEKHKKQTITVPDRPFPTWGLLNFSNPSNNGVLIQGTGTIGIGTTVSTQSLTIDCGIYNCSDLWKISN